MFHGRRWHCQQQRHNRANDSLAQGKVKASKCRAQRKMKERGLVALQRMNDSDREEREKRKAEEGYSLSMRGSTEEESSDQGNTAQH